MGAAKKTDQAKEVQAPEAPEAVTVSKVKPYPFKINLLRAEGTPPIPAQVQKMTDVGFLINLEATHFIKVGDHLIAKFELPVLHIDYTEGVRVVKTYQNIDQYVSGVAVKTYMAELHFKTISVPAKEKIKEFNRLIKQKV